MQANYRVSKIKILCFASAQSIVYSLSSVLLVLQKLSASLEQYATYMLQTINHSLNQSIDPSIHQSIIMPIEDGWLIVYPLPKLYR